MTDRRTMLAWFEYLDTPGREYTLSEFMALMLFHCRQHLGQINARMEHLTNAAEHTEGMIGALDLFVSETAARSGTPYPASRDVREALDRWRDEQRQAALSGEKEDSHAL